MSVGSQGWLEEETSIPIFCAVIVRGLFQEEEEAQGGGELTNPFSEGRTVPAEGIAGAKTLSSVSVWIVQEQ